MNWQEAIEQLEAELKHYTPSTARSYISCIWQLSNSTKKALSRMKPQDFQAFADDSPSPATQNQRVCAMRFFTRYVLNKEVYLKKLKRPKTQYKKINTKIENMIKKLDPQAKAIAALAYGNGLKASEITHLKKSDINKNIISLPNRLIPTNQRFWRYIEFWMSTHDCIYAFDSKKYNSSGKPMPIHVATIQRVFATYDLTFIDLRHAFALNVVKKGALPSELQYLLGLSHIESVKCYYNGKPPKPPTKDYIND